MTIFFNSILLLSVFFYANANANSNNNATLTHVNNNYVFAFSLIDNKTLTFSMQGFNLVNISNITIGPNIVCSNTIPNYNLTVDPCLQNYTRNDLCAVIGKQIFVVDRGECGVNQSQSPCFNETSSAPCKNLTSANDLCSSVTCYASTIDYCLAYSYGDIAAFQNQNAGYVGVACDSKTVCNDKFQCVPKAPPDRCNNYLQCTVNQLVSGVSSVMFNFKDGSATYVSSSQTTQVVVFDAPSLFSVSQNARLSPSTPFAVTYIPALAALNATFNCYACTDLTGQNQPFSLFTSAMPSLVYTSSSSVPLGSSIVYPRIMCMPVLTYESYGFTSVLPDASKSNITLRFLPLPQLYSVCPNQILSDIPATVVIQGDDFVNTPSLKCIFDGNIVTAAVFISAKSVKCTLVYSNRTSPAFVNLTITNDGVSTALLPLVVDVIGACSKIKPNSVASGSSCICPAGFEDVNNAYCQKCADGFFQPNQNQQSCIPCDATETTNGVLGSLTVAACVCKDGLYKADKNQTSCAPCPYGLDCSQASTGNYTVLAGFWRAKAGSTVILACSGGVKQCPAGNSGSGNQLCAQGYKGPMCSICKRGYGLLGGSCFKCPEKGLNSFLLLVLIIVTLTLVYILIKSTTREEKKEDSLGVTIKVLIAYWQVLYYIGKTSAHWSNQSSRFFEALIPVTLSPSFLSIQCSTDFGFYSNITLMMVLPLIIVAGIGTCHLLLWFYKNYQRPRSYFFMDAMDDNSKVTLVLLSLVHPTISQSVIRSFKCTSVEGTRTSFMSDDMRVDCSSSSYHRYVVVAALYVVFYIAGFLLLVMYRIMDNKDMIDMANQGMYIMNAKIYVFYVRGYKRAWYLWEFMIIFRKLAIVIVNSLFPDSIQLVWTNLVICFSLACTISAQPYRSILVNRLDTTALLTLLFTVTLGFHSKLMSDPNSKAVFVLLVIVNTLTTTLIMLSAFKTLKPRISEMFKNVVYYLDVNKFTRKEFFASRYVNQQQPNTLSVDIKMYSKADYRAKQQELQQQPVAMKFEDTSELNDEIEL